MDSAKIAYDAIKGRPRSNHNPTRMPMEEVKTAYMIQPKAGPFPIIILKRLPWKKPK